MIWLDAHLSPRVAGWIQKNLGHEATAIRDLGLRDADDVDIFERARTAQVILLTKDKDFSEIVARKGSPPAVIWLRCGNTSEERLKEILSAHLTEALELLAAGENLVEIQSDTK
jgi:predicted nuclease of predicted toxin-antitoxin system